LVKNLVSNFKENYIKKFLGAKRVIICEQFQ